MIFEQLLHRQVGVLDQLEQRGTDFAQIMRRYIRRHADRDPVGTVDQQVRNLRRQEFGLLLRAIEIVDEIDRVLVDIREHPLGQPRQPAFGVAVGRRRVAVDRAKIALPVDQRVAHAEGLRHPHQRIVNGAVAMRMVTLEHFADDAGALRIAPRRKQALAEHRVEDAPMDRFEAVAHVGQRAPDIHRHRVVQVGLPHVVFDIQPRRFVAYRFVAVGFSHLFQPA